MIKYLQLAGIKDLCMLLYATSLPQEFVSENFRSLLILELSKSTDGLRWISVAPLLKIYLNDWYLTNAQTSMLFVVLQTAVAGNMLTLSESTKANPRLLLHLSRWFEKLGPYDLQYFQQISNELHSVKGRLSDADFMKIYFSIAKSGYMSHALSLGYQDRVRDIGNLFLDRIRETPLLEGSLTEDKNP